MAQSSLPRPIYVYGCPGFVGGAASELWHTLRLWRDYAADVRLVPSRPLDWQWQERLDKIGVRLTDRFPRGATVVGFCEPRLRQDASWLRHLLGCRLVNVPCMAWLHQEEAANLLFDRYVFQSHYQRELLMMRLGQLGLRNRHGVLIRGAFHVADFNHSFRPRLHTREPLVVGRLSRAYERDTGKPAIDKFPPDLWQQYESIPYRPLKARVLGWGPEIERHCGRPPEWVEVLPEGAEPVSTFLANLHFLVPGIGCCRENWPRVGLEAMACGVPVLAEDKGGWPEMLGAGVVSNREMQAAVADEWAHDDEQREAVARAQRARLFALTNPEVVWGEWCQLFRNLTE